MQRVLRYVDHHGRPTEDYPYNPNGSPEGLTAVTTPDGRYTALMPHPERVFRNVQMSWTPGDASAASPWMRLFHNARRAFGGAFYTTIHDNTAVDCRYTSTHMMNKSAMLQPKTFRNRSPS